MLADYGINAIWLGLDAVLRWAEAVENRDWVVIHDSVLSEEVGKRIEHAWCERNEMVVDPAMPVGSRVIERDLYYRTVEPKIHKVYPSDDALFLSIKNRHAGPWNESEQLKE